jgi:2'-5' RNA ligase
MMAPASSGLPRAADLPTMSMAVRPASADDDLVTIGVVIDIPEPIGPQLQGLRRDFGDPLAEAIPAHVTLLPPTEVSPEVATAIRGHLEKVASVTDPFTVQLRGTGSFRPVSPVVYVALAGGAVCCDELQQAIRSGPLECDLPYPFHPHVTVAHHLDEAELDHAQATLLDYQADFTVGGVGLYEHGQDGVWRLRRRFEFGTL